MAKAWTYNPKDVLISFGTHAASGFADDSFINIEKNGDGFTQVVGCDGEVGFSADPDPTFTITFSCLQESVTNQFLNDKNIQDNISFDGMFPVTVKDLRGGYLFACQEARVQKVTTVGFGKAQTNREWTLLTADGSSTDSNARK